MSLEEKITITADTQLFLSQQVLYSSHIIDYLNLYATKWSWCYEEVVEKTNTLLNNNIVDTWKNSYPQLFDVINLQQFDSKTTIASVQLNKLHPKTSHIQLKNIHIQSVDFDVLNNPAATQSGPG